MSSTESEMDGYHAELPESEDDYVTETEETEEEEEYSNEYEKAVCQFSEMITAVPEHEVGGMVEIVSDFLSGKIQFQDSEEDKSFDNILFAVLITILIGLVALLIKTLVGEKTNFIHSP